MRKCTHCVQKNWGQRFFSTCQFQSIKIRRNLESNTLLDEKLQKEARKSDTIGEFTSDST
jgi:hypothetical protein